MSNEELDSFIDNINESSNEMNMIEEYILAIFQPELKLQEALNAANLIQKRGRKTEPKKKQKIFYMEKCMKVRKQRKKKKNDELLAYLNSNDPKDLSKLMSMAENSDINDLIKNGSSYLSTSLTNNNTFTSTKQEPVQSQFCFNMFWNNQPNMSSQPILNQFPLINPIDDSNRGNAFPLMFSNYTLPPNNDFYFPLMNMNNGVSNFNQQPGFY